MQCLNSFLGASLLCFFFSLDLKEAENLWGTSCPHCQKGVLHWACWRRKIRCPGSIPVPPGFEIQFSLCCSAEGCRRRVTPRSIRFAGRSPNLAAVVILAKIFTCGPSSKRIAEVQELLEVDERTIRRWQARWRCAEISSPWWQEIAGYFLLADQGIAALWELYRQRFPSLAHALAKLTLSCRKLWPNW